MDTLLTLTPETYNFIDVSQLKEREKKELYLFYKYLLYRSAHHSRPNKPKRELPKLPPTFYSPVKVNSYQKFDRNEIYADR